MTANLVSANTYISDVYFTIPDTVYMPGENITLNGFVYQANYANGTIVSNYSVLANALVNLTITSSSGTYISNYTFTTDSSGMFYSRSDYHTNASLPLVPSPSSAGNYYLKVQYIDLNGNVSSSWVEISVINKTIDMLDVSSDKASYNPLETMTVEIEAKKLVGDKILYVSNVSVTCHVRNSSDSILSTFTCTTGTNGKCAVTLAAPGTNGNYDLELDNYKAFSSFEVVPFYYSLYIKDDTGKSVKNVFASGDQGTIEVKISNASSSDSYTFSGYISNSSQDVMPSASGGVINPTILNSTNSFANTALFTISSSFAPGTYSAHITVSKTGDGSIASLTSFQVQDWMLSLEKRETSSGFEYEYSSFPNKTLNLQIIPSYRSNGSIIVGINSNSFAIQMKDNLNNVLATSNSTWNSTGGSNGAGCYQFSIVSPQNPGKYYIYASLTYALEGRTDTQSESRTINVINGIMSAQSTDKDGNIKELFGTNDYAYLSLSAYNLTSSGFNLSNAEVYLVSYMNGSEISYSQVNYSLVNASNSAYEWAWNSTIQRIKMDVPKFGGIYNVYLFGDNQSFGANAKFIVNPYDACTSAKTSLASTGSYYAWQFNTADTVYFDIKLTQANNPLGKATASNSSTNSSGNNTGGVGAQCNSDSTKQAISNATLTVSSVVNLESGAVQNVNTTQSTCQSSDNSGGYACTVKPFSKWEGGVNIVKFNILGQDGTTSVVYSRFEARSFYLYGYSSTWQNNPSSNITLNLQLYQAGTSWWQSKSGLSGTVKVKRVEYQGRDGEWLWPPIDSGYNITLLNSTSITSSNYNNLLTLSASYASGGVWKTGNYRVVLQVTTSSGDSDYGYAWFGVKLWDAYGYPIECSSGYCNYKSYFNSKENVTMYITISKAGINWWSSSSGGQDIYGNVSISVKKIQDCRTWPCKEMNSSQYTANSINVNSSSPGYWYANSINQSKYIIQINSTSGTWGTASYQVTLNVNGTDTGSAWFNTIAFYVETQPTNSSGAQKYNFRGSQNVFFNITTTKNYKSTGSSVYSRYNISDFINTTINSAVLRTWDYQTYKQKELNYPADINITPSTITGNGLINVTYLNGSWPSGYYYGELTMKNADNETSTGWLWFNVQPFRVNTYSDSYNIDSDQCVNASLYIYDSDWYYSTLFYGNYSVSGIYENIWTGNSPTTTYYSNYSINGSSNTSTFNSTTVVSVCPDSGSWGSGSWGGYHYLNVIVKDNYYNDTQIGWLSFRTVPFQASWGSVNNGNSIKTNANTNTTVSLTKSSNSAAANGILTKLYQWRYDNYQSIREEYTFSIGNSTTEICYSNVSGTCRINGTQRITVYAPSSGWRIGWNYIQAEWTETNRNIVQDYQGISFNALEDYSGWFDNWWYDSNNNYQWKYYLAPNENILIKLNVKDSDNQNANVNITNVYYADPSDTCQSESCRSYTAASWTNSSGGTWTSNGVAILNISVPSANWSMGYYYIKATVSGGGVASIIGGNVRVKDMTPPNITISSPANNATYNNSLVFSATTNENARCYVYVVSFDTFYRWNCGGWNSTNSSNSTAAVPLEAACNSTRYNYNGSSYNYEYVSMDYHFINNDTASYSCSGSSCSGYGNYDLSWQNRTNTFMSSTTKSFSYAFNVSNWISQSYGINVWCSDDYWNYASSVKAFKINNTS